MKNTMNFLFSTAISGAMLLQPTTNNAQSAQSEAIRPFKVHIPNNELADLRKRILQTRWSEKEIVTNQTQGVQTATMQKLAHYWASNYEV